MKKRFSKPASSNPLIELAKRAKMDKDPAIQQMIFNVGMTNNPHVYKALLNRLKMKALIEELDVFPFQPIQEEDMISTIPVQNRLELGRVMNTNMPFCYDIFELTKHCAIFGQTGLGKTTLIMHLMTQAIDNGVSVIAFDRIKKDFRYLTKKYKKLLVFSLASAFQLGVLQPPPGVSPKEWMVTFVQIFCKTHSLLDNSEALLLEAIDKLYRKFGTYNNSGVYPSLRHVSEHLKDLTLKGYSRTAQARDSVLSRLKIYLQIHPETFSSGTGFPLRELMDKSVVFELGGLTEHQCRFVINLLLYWVFLYRIAQGKKDIGLSHLIIIDEGKYLAPKEFNTSIGFTPISYLYDQFRALGGGLCLATQSPGYLDNTVFVNSSLKVCYGLGHGEDISTIQKVFQLTDQQTEYVGGKLQKGQAIVKCSRFNGQPFVIEVPPFEI